MLHDLDKTLRILLKDEEFGIQDSKLRDQITVSFISPSQISQFENVSPSKKASQSKEISRPILNFFCYHIYERKELRGDGELQFLEKEEGGHYKKQLPPVWLDCSYLVTAWVDLKEEDATVEEHRILNEALGVLARNEEIPQEILQGGLAGEKPQAILFETEILSGSQYPPIQLWQALGCNLRAAIQYKATIGVQVHPVQDLGGPIQEKVIHTVTR